jgi:hypothetical protein
MEGPHLPGDMLLLSDDCCGAKSLPQTKHGVTFTDHFNLIWLWSVPAWWIAMRLQLVLWLSGFLCTITVRRFIHHAVSFVDFYNHFTSTASTREFLVNDRLIHIYHNLAIWVINVYNLMTLYEASRLCRAECYSVNCLLTYKLIVPFIIMSYMD